jgi:hypothetical protein
MLNTILESRLVRLGERVQALENAKTESQLPKTADKHLSKRAQPRTLSGSSSAAQGKPMVVHEPIPEPPLYTTRYGRVIKPTQKLNQLHRLQYLIVQFPSFSCNYSHCAWFINLTFVS